MALSGGLCAFVDRGALSTRESDAHPDLRDGELFLQEPDVSQQRSDGVSHVSIVTGEGCGDLIDRPGMNIECRKRRR